MTGEGRGGKTWPNVDDVIFERSLSAYYKFYLGW